MKTINKEYFGAEKRNKKAIHRHSTRFYEYKGHYIYVDKILDVYPIGYDVYLTDSTNKKGLNKLNVPIPDGVSWNMAEKIIMKYLDITI
jgi:hypothetical protein